jgi:hypothetical protein
MLPRRTTRLLIILLVCLTSCGALEVSIERTPTPDAHTKATLEALATENARLATRVAMLQATRNAAPLPSLTPSRMPMPIATLSTLTATAEATPTPTYPHTPALTPLPTSPPQPGSLPQVVATITLGKAPRACVGSALAVDPQTELVYTAGMLDEQPCLTLIDSATGQVLETRALSFKPRFLLWDAANLYAIGEDDGTLIIADSGTGEIVARQPSGEDHFYNERVVVRDGWAYASVPEGFTDSATLYVVPLRDGTTLTVAGAHAFDLADDGRFAVAGMQGGTEATSVRVYAGTDGTLLAEREIGAGQPGESLAFDGQADRIFVARQQPREKIGEATYFVDVLDATSLETITTIEGQVWRLTADPVRGRIYGYLPSGQIEGFDARTGQSLGTRFTIPQGDPPGFTSVDPAEKLHVDPATGRVYVVYTDFDSGTWAAGFDPAEGEGAGDIQVPSRADWALDNARGRLYFAGRSLLLALDAVTLEPVWRMALSRDPVSAAIAPNTGCLFVGDEGGDVHVLNLQTYDEVRLLPGVGGYVDVDRTHGWLYAGDELAAGVSVYDLTTLEQRGLISQPGRPAASPADGKVYILEEDVYSGDGAMLAVIEGRTVRNSGCNGCSRPTSVVVDPQSGLTHVTTYGTWVGKPGPTSHVAVDPLTGHAFVARTTGGYRVVYTLAAYADLTLERLLVWRDGLYGQPLANPVTGHLYLTDGPRLVVLDGETLDLIGWLYPSSDADEGLIHAAVDTQSGRLYLLAGSQLLVLEGAGGRFETPSPQPVAGLPGPVEGVVPLPNSTIFVRAHGRDDYVSHLYRSTDGGQTWAEIRGGLPGAPNDLVFPPGGTLYAALVPALWRGDTVEASWGEGVYRSDNGGDTWAPYGQGLAHLRVSRLHASPDGNVYALATGTWPEQQSWPVLTIWQLGEDDRWSQVEVAEAGPFIDANGAIPAAYTQATRAAWHALTGRGTLYRPWGSELQRSYDGGQTWETIAASPAEYGVEVLSGISADEPPTLYWLTWDRLYCTTDGGESWTRLSHPALAESNPSAIAVAEQDGEEMLFVGTEAGDLLVLPAREADWTTE